MIWKIELQQKKLDQLFELTNLIEEDEVKSHLLKLLCIRTSGLLETAFKNLILEYLQGTSPKEIQSFVSSEIKLISNLKSERLITTLNRFSSEWSVELKNMITEEQFSSLNSLISNRNNIAHGENDSITFSPMKKYYVDTISVIVALRQIIKKTGNRH